MPVDKLILLSTRIERKFKKLAFKGRPRGGYRYFTDLRRTKYRLAILLYYCGRFSGVSKLEVLEVGKLGFTRVWKIVKQICGSLWLVRIFRIDFAVDLPNVSAAELAAHCRVAGVQSSAIFRSRGGVSYYPYRSRHKTLLVYERKRRLLAMRDPLAQLYKRDAHLTRLEIQLRGKKGVPIRQFPKIQGYADFDVLAGVSFQTFRPVRAGLKLQQRLAAERIQCLVQDVGLQLSSKMMTAAEWSYVSKTWFEPSCVEIQDVRAAMRQSIWDWFHDRLRFPRFSGNCTTPAATKK